MRRVARLAAVLVAALAWSAVVATLAEWSGLFPSRPALTPSSAVDDDPCFLRQPLPVGTDARCEIPLAREDGAPPLAVELVQTWDSTAPAVLIQHLRLREPGADAPLEDIPARSAATSTPLRFQRLAVVPAGGSEHLVYVLGACGGVGCGVNDVVVTAWSGRHATVLLRRRIGPLADIGVGEGRITVFDGSGGAAAARSPRMRRTFVWVGGVYAEVAREPVATAPPPASTLSR